MSAPKNVPVVTMFKFTATDRRAIYGAYRWDRLKKWQPAVTPVMCRAGYHLTTSAHLIEWLNAELWVAEGRGKTVYANNKVAFEQARLVERVTEWDERLMRHFAADCAERVLPIFERAVLRDDRPREAIEAARAFADGLITEQEMDAAGHAARAAARAATWAARAAAWDAAWAARDAAWDARHAAWDAARAAAWAARDAAGDAARDAARDAENDWDAARAARDAARDAENDWQARHLCDLLGIPYEPIPTPAAIEGVA